MHAPSARTERILNRDLESATDREPWARRTVVLPWPPQWGACADGMTSSLVTAGVVRVAGVVALATPTLGRGAVTALVAVVGLLVGSFLNVVVYRVPRHLSVVQPRSFCPHCDTPLRSLDNIPLVSWVVLGGRCRKCRAPISIRYPLVELATGIVFAAVGWGLGPHWAVAGFCVLGATFVALVTVERDGLAPPLPVAVVGTSLATAARRGRRRGRSSLVPRPRRPRRGGRRHRHRGRPRPRAGRPPPPILVVGRVTGTASDRGGTRLAGTGLGGRGPRHRRVRLACGTDHPGREDFRAVRSGAGSGRSSPGRRRHGGHGGGRGRRDGNGDLSRRSGSEGVHKAAARGHDTEAFEHHLQVVGVGCGVHGLA